MIELIPRTGQSSQEIGGCPRRIANGRREITVGHLAGVRACTAQTRGRSVPWLKRDRVTAGETAIAALTQNEQGEK